MPDLESSIAGWREQMLAAGLSANELDELECHLREEIERQLALKLNAHESFTLAVEKIGSAKTLDMEFNKNRHFRGFSLRRLATIPGTLATLWFVGCLMTFLTDLNLFRMMSGAHDLYVPLGLMACAINVAGMGGCILLFLGAPSGIRILRTVALLYLIACLGQGIPNYGQPTDWRLWCAAWSTASFITIWLLHRTPKQTAIA